MKYFIMCLTMFSLVGCAMFKEKPLVEKVVYVTTPIQLPARPTLPTWKATDMQCLSVEMKQKILDRDRIRKEYIDELETIIKSTHK